MLKSGWITQQNTELDIYYQMAILEYFLMIIQRLYIIRITNTLNTWREMNKDKIS